MQGNIYLHMVIQRGDMGRSIHVLRFRRERERRRTVKVVEREGDILRMTFETAWTPCYEVTQLMKAVYPSLRIYYKAEEPGCEVYLKNDGDGKYFPETEVDGHPYELMTEEREQAQTRLIRGIKDGSIKVNVTKERQIQ